MATIREIIEQVDLQKPNAFPQNSKLHWIAQLDGKVAQNVLLMGVEELQQFHYRYPEDLNREPLVGFPHDDLYVLWLEAQIDARNGEWNRYQNTIELYNAAYGNYVEWFANTYRPAEGCGQHGWVSNPNVPQYYITAYGLAVKAGYSGSLQEWLRSLKGEKGDRGDPGAKLRIGTVETLPLGSQATASIGGTAQDPVLDLGIPEGFYRAKAKAGFIYPLASETVPAGFLLCDGGEYGRAEYLELFAAIGTTYGAGDGETTFNVPNLKTRVPVGAGEDYPLGKMDGEAVHTLSTDEMPRHRHEGIWDKFGGSEWGINWGVAEDVESGGAGSMVKKLNTWETQGLMTNEAGKSVPHNNMQPYTVVNYIIATGKNTGVDVADIIQGAQALPLRLEYGGTGATDLLNARRNLEIYPVGAIYMSVLDTDPATLFGGTWERLKDRFLLAAGEDHTAGSEGGEATVTLTSDEMPAHSHRIQTYISNGVASENTNYGVANYDSNTWWQYDREGENVWDPRRFQGTLESGKGLPHNNLPPYLAVYMWKRTA